MGLLDDAIREHLELKRRRGADPGMVAREEHDALAAVFADEGDDREGDLADGDRATGGSVPVEGQPMDDAELADLSTVGQETAELDMQAVMEGDVDAAGRAFGVAPIDDRPLAAGRASERPDEASFEWEVPAGPSPEKDSEEAPGQERLSFD